MKVCDQTDLSCTVGLQAESAIEVTAIIQATAIVRMAISLHTTPRGATPVLDANKGILDKDPIQGILPTHVHPGDVLTGPDLHPDPLGGTDPILTAEPDPQIKISWKA